MTLWPLSAQVHRTVSPTEMLTVSGTNTSPPCPTATSTICAGSRWHAAHGWLAVLIDNAQRWRALSGEACLRASRQIQPAPKIQSQKWP